MEKEKKNALVNLMTTGAELTGNVGGALLSGYVEGIEGAVQGAVVGGMGGVLATKVMIKIGEEIHKRIISARENVRTGAALTFAVQKLAEKLQAGKQYRSDDFFEDSSNDRASAEEILEGIFLAAQKEYEERKVKYLGNLYASILTSEEISREHSNQLIKMLNSLSYRQLCILQLFQERRLEKEQLISNLSKYINKADIVAEVRDLQQKGLISLVSRWQDVDDNSIQISIEDIDITKRGVQFCDLLSLEEIPKIDLDKLTGEVKLV